jgi:hypothetical protein
VEATIANGKLLTLDTSAAEKMPNACASFIARISGRTLGQPPALALIESASNAVLRRRRRSGLRSYIALAVADTSKPLKPPLMQSARPTRKKAHVDSASKPAMILMLSSPATDQCRDCRVIVAMPKRRSPVRQSSWTKLT